MDRPFFFKDPVLAENAEGLRFFRPESYLAAAFGAGRFKRDVMELLVVDRPAVGAGDLRPHPDGIGGALYRAGDLVEQFAERGLRLG